MEVRRRYVQENVVRNTIETIDLANEIGYEPQASDEMRINYLPGWRDRETANLIGEVSFPGEYVLTPGETISSLIERAGGFTSEAFVDALRFRSAEAQAQQQAAVNRALLQERKNAAMLVSNQENAGLGASAVTRDAFALEAEGRIVIDIHRILSGDRARIPPCRMAMKFLCLN